MKHTLYRIALMMVGLLLGLLGSQPAFAQNNPTVTELLHSGPNGNKLDLVIIGDGFQAGADQTTFDNYVQQEIINGVFGDGPLWESMNSFNIYRVNTFSQDSGVTQVDANGNITTQRNTALDFHFSGNWNRCWMEFGPNTTTNLNNILDNLVPQRDYVFVVLNTTGFGGCRRGTQLAVTMGANWTVGAHEMGHMVGNLCDEYIGGASPGTYSGTEPGCVNLTTNINRATLKWRDYVDPNTPLPTTFTATTMDAAETAGAFAGGTLGQSGFNAGIWRPTFNSRMNSNSPSFGPVGYNQMMTVMDPWHEFDYLGSYVGDFNGDGRDDVVIHNNNSLALYQSTGNNLQPLWIATGAIPVWDDFKPGDRFYVGDFDGDGRDDLFVFNYQDWAIPYFAMLRSTGSGFETVQRYDEELPGWDDMKPNDQFFVGDFNGDNRDDIFVFNGRDWAVGYLGMLRSMGGSLMMVQRYDDTLPGWDRMLANDQFYVADIDGDGRDELYVFNGRDWSVGYLQLFHSTGFGLNYVRRFDEELPGWDDMRPNDRFYVADFDNDRRDDLYVFNGFDWNIAYLEKLQSVRNTLRFVNRWDGNVPGWDDLKPNDQFYVADVNGDGLQDLYAYNALDWATEYLGVLRSTGVGGLSGSWQDDWIGNWNLGQVDLFLVGNFNGGAGWDDLFIRNRDWFGLLRSQSNSTTEVAIHPFWIHDHLFNVNGWW